MGKLIFVRHGQTQMNADKLFFGKLDPSLNDKGREQIKISRNKIENIHKLHYDNIYSSDLKRAKESAEILNYLEKEIIYDSRLQEINFGIFEGYTYKELEEKFPEQVKKSQKEWETYNFETGESPKEMQERAVSFLNDLDKTKDNLVVTHWGIICSTLTYLFSHDLASYWHYSCDNGGIIVINFVDDFPVLIGLNI